MSNRCFYLTVKIRRKRKGNPSPFIRKLQPKNGKKEGDAPRFCSSPARFSPFSLGARTAPGKERGGNPVTPHLLLSRYFGEGKKKGKRRTTGEKKWWGLVHYVGLTFAKKRGEKGTKKNRGDYADGLYNCVHGVKGKRKEKGGKWSASAKTL